MLSGGEPFEHPQIKEILTILAKTIKLGNCFKGVAIATNGFPLLEDSNLYDWYRDYVKKVPILTQITNVKKYYPKVFTKSNYYRLQKIKNSCLETSDSDILLYPLGRALNIPAAEYQTKGPKCANIKLLAKQFPLDDLSSIIAKLSFTRQKLCVPRINIDGSIALGESQLCPPVGTIDDSPEVLLDKIRKHKCIKCKIAVNRMQATNPMAYQLFMNDYL